MYQPKNDWIVVERITGRTTDAGVILPDGAEKDRVWARVVAVGPGRLNDKGERIPCQSTVGEYTIVVPQGPCPEFVLGSKTYALVKDSWVVASVPEEDRQPVMIRPAVLVQ